MFGMLAFLHSLNLQSWRRRRADRREQRFIERAIRENGVSWLVSMHQATPFTPAPLDVYAQALRNHFNEILSEPIPERFLNLLRNLELVPAH
jgi:Anti-sigma factor NepR